MQNSLKGRMRDERRGVHGDFNRLLSSAMPLSGDFKFGFDHLPSLTRGVTIARDRDQIGFQVGYLAFEILLLRSNFLALRHHASMCRRGHAQRGCIFCRQARAAQDIDAFLQRGDFCFQIAVFPAQKVEFGARWDQFLRLIFDVLRYVGTELAFHRPERHQAWAVQMVIGDRLAVDAGQVGRTEIVQPIMAPCGDQFGVMPGDGPIGDLNRIISEPPDGNAFAREHMGRFAFLVGKFYAKTGHENRRRGRAAETSKCGAGGAAASPRFFTAEADVSAGGGELERLNRLANVRQARGESPPYARYPHHPSHFPR